MFWIGKRRPYDQYASIFTAMAADCSTIYGEILFDKWNFHERSMRSSAEFV